MDPLVTLRRRRRVSYEQCSLRSNVGRRWTG